MQTSDSIVIIPTYNERENIENIIRAVFALKHGFHILVIEDGSPDGTAAIVKTLQQEFPERLFMVERKGKLGLGTAYIAGFKWALQRGYEYIFEMDADFSHNPQDLPRLYRACSEEGADVAIGSRYVSGVNVVNWPMGRVLMSYFASKYVRFITGLPIHDTTAGFVLGISMMEVTPPAAAARLSVRMSALWVSPGSRKCTWSSMMPGNR